MIAALVAFIIGFAVMAIGWKALIVFAFVVGLAIWIFTAIYLISE
jgi:hypothetical protein